MVIRLGAEPLIRVIGRERDGVTGTQAENFIERARTDARAARLNLPKGAQARAHLDAGAASATVNRELARLSHVVSKAVEWRWLTHVPARPKKLAEISKS